MSWTYTGLPNTTTPDGQRDAVRLLCQDTDETRPLLQDEEIDFFLAQLNRNVYRSAAACCRALADPQRANRSIGDLSIGDASTSYATLADRYEALADLRAVPYAGGLSAAQKAATVADTDRVPPSFTRTLHETPGLASRPGTS